MSNAEISNAVQCSGWEYGAYRVIHSVKTVKFNNQYYDIIIIYYQRRMIKMSKRKYFDFLRIDRN